MSKEGASLLQITQTLYEQDIPFPRGKAVWNRKSLRKILNSEKHLRKMLLQKAFVANYLNHRLVKNYGQQDKHEVFDIA